MGSIQSLRSSTAMNRTFGGCAAKQAAPNAQTRSKTAFRIASHCTRPRGRFAPDRPEARTADPATRSRSRASRDLAWECMLVRGLPPGEPGRRLGMRYASHTFALASFPACITIRRHPPQPQVGLRQTSQAACLTLERTLSSLFRRVARSSGATRSARSGRLGESQCASPPGSRAGQPGDPNVVAPRPLRKSGLTQQCRYRKTSYCYGSTY